MKRTQALASILSIATLAILLLPGASAAQEVELNPGYINGTIQVGAETISQARIYAYSDSLEAETTIYPNASSAAYSLTVQVEPGASRDWSVYAQIYTEGGNNHLYLPSTEVTVVDGVASVLDLVETDPCYVEGTITVLGGELSYAQLYASQTAPPYNYAWAYVYETDPLPFRFAVLPGVSYRFQPYVTLTSGTSLYPPEVDFDCPAGATVTLDVEVEAPSSSILGSIEFPGPNTVDQYYVYASGPAYKYYYLYSPFGADNDTPYELTDLPDGTFTVGVSAWLNSYDDYLTFPLSSFDSTFDPANRPEIVSGSSPTVNVSDTQAFIEGTATVSGTVDASDLSYVQIRARTSDYNGYSQDRLDVATGNYDLIVVPGEWIIDYFYISLQRATSDPDGYLNETIYYYDYQASDSPLTVAAGETASRHFDLPMGTVTINFSVAGGGVLSDPQLEAYCYDISPTGEYLGSYSFYSYSTGQVDVTSGWVTMVGLEGDCTVTAQAYVGGSLTSFGEFPITIEPGVDQEIEIGGPGLSVDVESGFCIDADEITVTGLATDDVAVASVTVNGVAATLTPTGGTDEHEVGFSLAVPIAGRGAHEIVTVATDTSGKTAADTRTIYNDDGLPVVSFTPADGATFPITQTSVPVEGTVVDESDDVSVTLDGSVLTLDTAGDFSGSAAVDLGDNFITVVATDSCGSTTVTHKVTLIDNQPPVAICQDVEVEAGPVCTADADVNDGSSDPDGDPITLTPDPASPYSLGSSQVTLTVDDGGAADSCVATVTVIDATAPTISLNSGPTTLECSVDVYSEAGATASDACDPDVSPITIGGDAVNSTALGTYNVTYDATDDSGNPALQVVRSVTVIDTIAPVITACPADREILADDFSGLASVPDLVPEAGAADACNLVVTQDVAAGSQVGAGSPVVTLTASDGLQSAECTVTLTVRPPACPSTDEHLVGHWTFDEGVGVDAFDSSGNGNHGKLSAFKNKPGGKPLWIAGHTGETGDSALLFDGSDGYVDAGSDATLDNLSELTYSAWVKRTANGDREIFSKQNSYHELRFRGAGVLRGCIVGNLANACSDSNELVPLDTWTHVAMTYSHSGDKKVHLYIDGTEATYAAQSMARGQLKTDRSARQNLGRRSNNTRYYWGVLDEMLIFDQVVADCRIAELAEGGGAP